MFGQVISATSHDQDAIRALIRDVQINPFGVKWQNFKVIKDENGRLLACGQLKPHKNNVIELASIAVVKEYRRQGLAKQIIEALLEAHIPPIWLMCEHKLASFYAQFGFVQITAVSQMPYPFKGFQRIYSLIQKLLRPKNRLAIMCKRQ